MEFTPKPSSPAATGKPTLKQRMKALIAESGAIVLWVYFGIFALVLVSTATALEMGVKLDGVAGAAGIWGAAYVFTKLTQPLRIAVTLAVTPVVAAFLRRFRKQPQLAPELAMVEPSVDELSATGRQREQ
ncbi:MAG TPA: hypothetical protein VFS67_09065 [Polyangiaceae bacterium]|jgi:hypothetical protein|nr:hypothetical protein [Polyangiaceae bacterium]